MNKTHALAVVIGTSAILGMGGMLAAQSVFPGRAPATLDDLLAEVRGLRNDMAQTSSATIKTQLLVARLQLQEQRINTLVRQLTEAQTELGEHREAAARMDADLKRREELWAVASGDERRQLEMELADIKPRIAAQAAQFQQRLQELMTREADLSRQFSTEQARWSDFNDRLDTLERSLPSGPAR